MKLRRREFLALAGSAAAGLALADWLGLSAALSDEASAAAPVPEALGPESISILASVCGACPGGCGIQVRVVNGLPRAIRGNPLSPLNRGGLCPRGIAGLQSLYDPDRVRGPLARAGARGEGRWKQVSWDEAMRTLAERMGEIRSAGKAGEVVVWSGPARGTMRALVRTFARAYGTGRVRIEGLPLVGGMVAANYFTQGIPRVMGIDLERTKYLLSFGAPILDGWWSPVRFLRGYGKLRGGGPRAKVVQVDARQGVSSVKADEWVAIRPGTEAALALGIARVIVNEGLYDRDFVSARTFGFEDWTDESGGKHRGYRRFLLEDVDLAETSRASGVPVATISRLAKEFARTKPAVALGESRGTNATATLLCVHSLNALAGSIQVPGGIVVQEDVPLGIPGESEPWGEDSLAALGERAEAVILLGANPAFEKAQVPAVGRLLRDSGFVVACAGVLDETARMADLVLPDHHYLEKLQDDPLPPVGKGAMLGLSQPVVAPLHDTRHAGDVLLALARGIGDDVARGLPWEDYPAMVKESVMALASVQQGSLFEQESEEAWIEGLEERGWWYPSFSSPEEFWTQLREKGGWWDPRRTFGEWGRAFRTPSGKFEFYSQLLAAEAQARARPAESGREALERLGIRAGADLAFLPHYEPPERSGGEEYPFVLAIVRVLSWGEGALMNQPLLQEFPSAMPSSRWDSWVEIHPEAAAPLGIADRDRVRVESPHGRVTARAKLTRGVAPETVAMPFGQGHSALGRLAAGRGANPLELLPDARDAISGMEAWESTRVRIVRV